MDKFYGATLEPYADEYEYEDFIYDLEYFNKYIGKEVYVKGYNLNWRGVNGEKVFLFNNIKQIYGLDYGFENEEIIELEIKESDNER